jgi:hypothetical protein
MTVAVICAACALAAPRLCAWGTTMLWQRRCYDWSVRLQWWQEKRLRACRIVLTAAAIAAGIAALVGA